MVHSSPQAHMTQRRRACPAVPPGALTGPSQAQACSSTGSCRLLQRAGWCSLEEASSHGLPLTTCLCAGTQGSGGGPDGIVSSVGVLLTEADLYLLHITLLNDSAPTGKTLLTQNSRGRVYKCVCIYLSEGAFARVCAYTCVCSCVRECVPVCAHLPWARGTGWRQSQVSPLWVLCYQS